MWFNLKDGRQGVTLCSVVVKALPLVVEVAGSRLACPKSWFGEMWVVEESEWWCEEGLGGE